MADVDVTIGGTTGHASRRGRHTAYKLSRKVTGVEAVAAKGSALASADVIQAIDLPADTMVLYAGLNVLVADSGTNTPASVTTGVDAFTTEEDLDLVGQQVCIEGLSGPLDAADTLDITLGTLSSSGDDWEVDLWCIVMDCAPYAVPTSAKGT